MSIELTSTTDSMEHVQSVMGTKPVSEKSAEETKSASSESEKSEKQDENTEASDATEKLEEDADASESEDDSDGLKDEAEEQKPKKKNGFKKRIDKLVAEKSKAQQEVEFWKQQAISGKPAKVEEQKPQEQKAEVVGKPKADNFDTHEEYVEALTDWKLEQRDKQAEQKAAVEKAKAELVETNTQIQKRIDDFKKSHPDFDEVVESAEEIPLQPTFLDAMRTSKMTAELMYELAGNHEEMKRINSLTPFEVVREIGRIEARLSQKSETKTTDQKVTKAPPPITPVNSKSVKINKSIFDEDLTQAEYEALRAKQKNT